jgi:uncharacterized membrane protein YkgB
MAYRFILSRDEARIIQTRRYDDRTDNGEIPKNKLYPFFSLLGLVIIILGLLLTLTVFEVGNPASMVIMTLGLVMVGSSELLRAREKQKYIEGKIPGKGNTDEVWLDEAEASLVIQARGLGGENDTQTYLYMTGIGVAVMLFLLGAMVITASPEGGLSMGIASGILAWYCISRLSRKRYKKANEYLKNTFKEDV